MYIFLDFDGVLRRVTSDPARFDGDCLEKFEAAVRPLSAARIVISSTWRLAMSLAELRQCFSADVAERIVGVTPEVNVSTSHARFEEIQAYLKARGAEDRTWIAIDDHRELYPCNAPVLVTKPERGFDLECVLLLWQHFEKGFDDDA